LGRGILRGKFGGGGRATPRRQQGGRPSGHVRSFRGGRRGSVKGPHKPGAHGSGKKNPAEPQSLFGVCSVMLRDRAGNPVRVRGGPGRKKQGLCRAGGEKGGQGGGGGGGGGGPPRAHRAGFFRAENCGWGPRGVGRARDFPCFGGRDKSFEIFPGGPKRGVHLSFGNSIFSPMARAIRGGGGRPRLRGGFDGTPRDFGAEKRHGIGQRRPSGGAACPRERDLRDTGRSQFFSRGPPKPVPTAVGGGGDVLVSRPDGRGGERGS